MTIDLVDGKAGKAHIDSDDRGSFNIGTMGPGCYVLNVKNKFALTMDSANSGTVDTGGLIMWGRYAHCTEPETITVENGSQNMKRNDLVVMRYTKTTDKIETASLVVIKGTPAASTPSDPQINEVDEITSTTTIADMPLYRIPLDGITVGTPVPLFNVLAPMSELWDSVTQTYSTTLKNQNSGSFTMVSSPRITVRGGYIYLDLASFKANVGISVFKVYSFASGVKPSKDIDLGSIGVLTNGAYSKNGIWYADGSVSVGPSMSPGDYLIALPRVIPVPDGVTFSQ